MVESSHSVDVFFIIAAQDAVSYPVLMRDTEDLTGLLRAWSRGDAAARDQLMPRIYDDLHAIAARQLRNERPGHTLQPTAVVNELYMKLHAQRSVRWESRKDFFAVAAKLIRRILVDHARKRQTARRGGDFLKVSLDQSLGIPIERAPEIVALDDALRSLESYDERSSRVVELHIFGGLKFSEIAATLGVAQATVYRDWELARLWLKRELYSEELSSESNEGDGDDTATD